MIGLIIDKNKLYDVENKIKEINGTIIIKDFGEHGLNNALNKINNIPLKTVVLDTTIFKSDDEIFRQLRDYRLLNKKDIQFIIMVDDNKYSTYINNLTLLNIYDVINVDKAGYIDDIANCILSPYSYNDVLKHLDFNVEIPKTSIKTKNTPPQIKEVIKETVKYVNINNKTVGVFAITDRAGATFFSSNFTKYLSLKIDTSLVELGYPYYYDLLGLHSINDFDFYDIYQNIADEKYLDLDKISKYNNINLLIKNPMANKETSHTCNEYLKLLYASKSLSKLSLIDFGNDINLLESLVNYLDYIIYIIDPFVPDVEKSMNTIKRIRKLDINVNNLFYVINKFNKGVNKGELIKYLRLPKKSIFTINFINPDLIYDSVYRCHFPIENNIVFNNLENTFYKIASKMIDSSLLEKKNKKKGWFK